MLHKIESMIRYVNDKHLRRDWNNNVFEKEWEEVHTYLIPPLLRIIKRWV